MIHSHCSLILQWNYVINILKVNLLHGALECLILIMILVTGDILRYVIPIPNRLKLITAYSG